MLSNKTQLTTKTKTSEHTYQCDPATPIDEVVEALSELRSYAYGRMKELQEQQKASAEVPAEQPQG